MMRIKDRRRCMDLKRSALIGFCIGMTAVTSIQSIAAEYQIATYSNAALLQMRSIGTGNLWENWTGDMSFLSGAKGNGTKEKPYQISTREQLMGLSELAAMGMEIGESEGTYPGDYRGSHFQLMRNIDLGGMNWIPIGFYKNEADFYLDEACSFEGHFDGNGKTVSNFRIADSDWKHVGLFGTAKNSVIKNLIVKPGAILYGSDSAGILIGRAENCEIREVTVMGTVKTDGTAGGIAGVICDGTVIENCTADHVAVDTGEKKEVYAGGIAGKAAESFIVDCVVNTGDSYTARIQGYGYVGGIVGFQNGTDIFNVHVMGTVGGSGSQAIGGVTGKYASGKMKVARFEGTIANSGLGSLAHEGTFIGTHDTGFHFRYGTEAGADLAYLFTDSEGKIAAGICGSGIPDDNSFDYDAHIGFWHGKDNFFTLVRGQNTKPETKQYFFEELETGILGIWDTADEVKEMLYAPDHFAPNSVGRPTRGYLVSVLQIDTAANVENYYDVASLTARGGSVYSKTLDKDTRGAVAAGDIVTVTTAPNNTANEKYQMNGVPTYTDQQGNRVDMDYQTGGAYSFVMPACDTELLAVYEKVAAGIRVNPEEMIFRVVQERSGNRKNPSIVTEVKDKTGKLIARYLGEQLEKETEVQDITVEAVVDKNNDVADCKVLWTVDDSDLLILKRNGDEDADGYTAKSASVELNLQADFFQKIIRNAETAQKENGYRYAIPDTVYGNGMQGGLAVLTANTRPSASFEGKPVTANCKIPVTFQIKDRTYVASEGASLNKKTLEFVVTRILTGSRKAPTETIAVTEPQTLTAVFRPDYFDKKDISWSINDTSLISVEGEEKEARVTVCSDAKWIRDLIAVDMAKYKNDWRVVQTGSGTREAAVTVRAEDMMGHTEYAVCEVRIQFETVDQTYLYSSSSSGGSSGGGSSGGGGGSKTAGTLTNKNPAADSNGPGGVPGSVIGTWIQENDGRWKFSSGNRQYCNEWAYIYNPYARDGQNAADWFWFDEYGYMKTGWKTDVNGMVYYLWPESDGTQGRMVTGWNWIVGEDGYERCYFFNPESDGTKGRLWKSGITPDGYQVNEIGIWEVNGVEQIRMIKEAASR